MLEGTANIEEEWGIDVVSYECQVRAMFILRICSDHTAPSRYAILSLFSDTKVQSFRTL